MRLRTLFAFVNLAAFVGAVLFLRVFPQYDTTTALYVLLGWMSGSLVILYGPWGNRELGAPQPARVDAPSGSAAGRPLEPADVPFCIYCAAPLAKNVPVCPTCGHRAPHL